MRVEHGVSEVVVAERERERVVRRDALVDEPELGAERWILQRLNLPPRHVPDGGRGTLIEEANTGRLLRVVDKRERCRYGRKRRRSPGDLRNAQHQSPERGGEGDGKQEETSLPGEVGEAQGHEHQPDERRYSEHSRDPWKRVAPNEEDRRHTDAHGEQEAN